jgi:DNA-binding response OmpR family regulator
MATAERRREQSGDRRAVPRGGRRPYDQPGRFPNLLIADSYEGARIPCARYLDHFGFRVDQATDGKAALSLIQSEKPHVILVELSLPTVSATGIAEWLEREPSASGVPMIVMVSDFETERVEKLPRRASAVLIKPFPLSAMLQEVRRALRARPPVPC